MKVLELSIACMAVAVGFAANAGGKVAVTVTDDTHHDPGSGYYIKYSLNGNTYRSDEMGPKANAVAWEHMSDEDKEKTVKVFLFYQDRVEQFGEEAAIKMGNWHNRYWIEAAEILKDRLMAANYPELEKNFTDSTYFDRTFRPTTCSDWDIDQYIELKTRFAAIQSFYSWARQAYLAMRQAEWKRTQVAVKSVSGDVISLICDKVLVPNITPSGALAGAESIGQQTFSEVLEYLDKWTGFSDEVVEKVVGKRVTSDVAKEVMTLMGHIVDCQNAIIHRCLKACEALRDQIDAKYAELKEEKRLYNEHWAEETRKARDRFEEVPDKEEPDPALVSEKEALEKAIEEKRGLVAKAQGRYDKAIAVCDEVCGKPLNDVPYDVQEAASRERQEAKKALDAAQAAFNAAVQKLNDFLDGIYNDLKAKQDAFIAKYEQAMAEHAAAEPTNRVFMSSYPALEKYRGSYTPLDLDADTVAPMQGAHESYLAERGAFADKQDEWYAEGMQLEIDAKRECCEILSTAEILQDWRKTGFVKAWDCADRVHKACMILAPGMMRADADRYAEARRLEMEDFLDRWTVCNNLTRPEVEKRAAELEQKKTELHFEIVGEYNGAYDKLDASLDALPSYVKSQTMCISGPVITEKSELAQRFLARGATGTVKEALAVRDELDNFANDYRTAKNKVRAAERRISAFESMYGTFDDFVPQAPKVKNSSGAPLKSSYVAGFVRRTISDERRGYISPLLALERDFKNYTYAHCTMLDQLGELNANRELYSTNVLEDATQDPYVRTAYAARCLSAVPKPGYYTTSSSIVMPGYYVGYGKTPYEIAMLEASDRNRGTCSYTYFIAGYAAAAGNVVSDPFDNHIKPLLDEIDAARAAVIGKTEDEPGVDPGEDDTVNPDMPDVPSEPEPEVSVVAEADIAAGVTIAKAATVGGVWLDGTGTPAGSLELKLAKANKKTGLSKVTGSVTLLGGKKVSLKADVKDGYALGEGPQVVTLTGKGVSLTVKVGADTAGNLVFTGAGEASDSGVVTSAALGGEMANPSGLAAYLDKSFALGVEGEILSYGGVDFVPYHEPVAVKGTKWSFAKAASVKFAKPKGSKDKTKVLQGYDDPKKPNVSGLKLTYTAKKGTFKGSFKVYALQGAEGKEKLKKYTVNVEGVVVGGKGYGRATSKKPAAGPFDFRVR